MTEKKQKTKKSKSIKAKTKTKSKKQIKPKNRTDDFSADAGIVVIDDDLTIDKKIVNEERRAYLEEARSQETSD